MTALLHRLPDNVIYRLESLTPTYAGASVPRFRSFDPINADVPDATAGLRMFYVDHVESGPDEGATEQALREATHRFVLNIYYPQCLPWLEMQHITLQDRHDVLKDLRNTTSFVGFRGNTTTSIGLFARRIDGVTANKDGTIWIYRYDLECQVREDEV